MTDRNQLETASSRQLIAIASRLQADCKPIASRLQADCKLN
jgi:hypothetical protein